MGPRIHEWGGWRVASGKTVHEWGHECTNGVGGEWRVGQPSTNRATNARMGVGQPSTNGVTNARMEWVTSGEWQVAIGKWKPLRLCTSAPPRYVKLWEW
jgi:hypothetical protein